MPGVAPTRAKAGTVSLRVGDSKGLALWARDPRVVAKPLLGQPGEGKTEFLELGVGGESPQKKEKTFESKSMLTEEGL